MSINNPFLQLHFKTLFLSQHHFFEAFVCFQLSGFFQTLCQIVESWNPGKYLGFFFPFWPINQWWHQLFPTLYTVNQNLLNSMAKVWKHLKRSIIAFENWKYFSIVLRKFTKNQVYLVYIFAQNLIDTPWMQFVLLCKHNPQTHFITQISEGSFVPIVTNLTQSWHILMSNFLHWPNSNPGMVKKAN